MAKMFRTAVAVWSAIALALTGVVAAASGSEGSLALPADLVALEQKMGELQITSMRFSTQTSIVEPTGDHELLETVLKSLLPSRVSGEGTVSPRAWNVTLGPSAHALTLRLVGKTTYLYLPQIASHDHNRPWIKLGPGGLLELLAGNRKNVKMPKTAGSNVGPPAIVEPPFDTLRKVLAGAQEVRELGAGTVNGQPVTTFLALVTSEQLEHEHLASTARPVSSPKRSLTATLEVSLAQNGLPVRTVITANDAGIVITATVDIPAVNFPLVIEAPPASQTISIPEIRKLERRARKHRRHGADRKESSRSMRLSSPRSGDQLVPSTDR